MNIRFTIDLDNEVHKKLKIYSVESGKSMKEIISELICEKLEKEIATDKERKEKINRFMNKYDDAMSKLAKL
jgi:hypothetical protein